MATEGIRILDGSGLTAENRLTAQALVEALAAVHGDFALAPEFTVSLPVGGVDGTLKRRLDSVEGRVRAKTGFIRSAIALSGYAQGSDGTPYTQVSPISWLSRGSVARTPCSRSVKLSKVCHYITQPLVELYGGCMVVLNVS